MKLKQKRPKCIIHRNILGSPGNVEDTEIKSSDFIDGNEEDGLLWFVCLFLTKEEAKLSGTL